MSLGCDDKDSLEIQSSYFARSRKVRMREKVIIFMLLNHHIINAKKIKQENENKVF